MFPFFTVDDYEKEQEFLQDMTSKGWYLKDYKGFRYYFEKSEPNDYVYRIDYKEPLDDLDEYLSVFEDAGWEVVLQYPVFHGAWIYFRKPNYDENVEIFTNDESRLSLLKKNPHTLDDFWSIHVRSIVAHFARKPTNQLAPYYLANTRPLFNDYSCSVRSSFHTFDT